MNAKEVFEAEWTMWKSGGARFSAASDADDVRAGGGAAGDAGDAAPNVGEVRIFADAVRPFTALVAEAKGLSGWLIVPVSPFTVPASSREMLVGERVFQLWNACVASRGFVARSWVVADVAREDVDEILSRLPGAAPGRVGAGDSCVAQYEREFLVAGGSFRPLAAPRRMKRLWTGRVGYSIAAMLAVGLGVAWLAVNERKGFDDREAAMSEPPAESYAEKYVESDGEEDGGAVAAKEADPLDVVAADINASFEPPPLPVAPVASMVPAAEPPQGAAGDVVMVVSSPIKMHSMLGSRTPGSAYAMARGGRSRSEPPLLSKNMPWMDTGWTPMPQSTSRYAEFKENGFIDPRDEPLSTFALDVDTASYTFMRQHLDKLRRFPPPESVRLAEYVNYFKYSYAEPRGAAPVAADCELAPCPWAEGHKLLRIGIRAKEVATDAMPPCNLTFLVDCSGSMDCNDGMEMAKCTLRMLAEKLRDTDHVSIVTYACGARVRLPSTPGSEKGKILSAIDSLTTGGGTSGGAGLQLAYTEAMKNFDKAANNRVILVTDGDFNIGISSPQELERFIAKKRDTGIFLSVLGVGFGNYQDAAMKRLSNAGNGNCAYVDSVLEAKKVASAEFGGTLFTVAKDVKVQLEFNPAQVAQYRLLGYETRMLKAEDFNDDMKDAGEIGSGHTMTAFYEIIPADAAPVPEKTDPLKYQKAETLPSDELFTVKMRWKKPDGDVSEKREIPYRAADLTKPEPSEDFRFASAVAECALVLGESQYKGNASLEAALERARASKGADAEGYRAEFIRLVEKLLIYKR